MSSFEPFLPELDSCDPSEVDVLLLAPAGALLRGDIVVLQKMAGRLLQPAKPLLTPQLCKAARDLLNLSREELQVRAGVGHHAVMGFEARQRPSKQIIPKLQLAFEKEGLLFIAGGVVFRAAFDMVLAHRATAIQNPRKTS